MMKTRQTGILVFALFAFGYGVSVLWLGRAAWIDGIQEASGAQATAIGIVSLIFSLFALFSYVRARQRLK
jgi:membrane protein implicated in regulation of membrane protease activity